MRTVRVDINPIALYMVTGNLSLARKELRIARTVAERAGDEAGLVDIAQHDSELAQDRGDEAKDLRASLEELEHARKSGVDQLVKKALADLGDTYMHTGQYALSLEYSRQALALAQKARECDPIILFNIGIAEIGVGRLSEGKRRIDGCADEAAPPIPTMLDI